MKYFITFIFIISLFAYPQESQKDSLNIKEIKANLKLLNDFELYYSLNNIENNTNEIPVNSNPKTIGLWTSFAVSQPDERKVLPEETKSFMLSPLYIRYRDDSKFNSVRYILGMAQTAAVGYMAYVHLKKYGFIK